jgi:hypothetical protein
VPETYVKRVSKWMEESLSKRVDEKSSTKDIQGLRKKMVEVCEKSMSLKLMMERSKEGYTIRSFNTEVPLLYSKIEDLVEAIGVENGLSSEASDEIAYVLFGGLQKTASQPGGKEKTLIKAEVILKKKE